MALSNFCEINHIAALPVKIMETLIKMMKHIKPKGVVHFDTIGNKLKFY